ncbi:MAG: type II toxin-antitoxin system HicA family toxin [Chloroflexi bacterium]|nr:type II toxin-antitoxin system HicA family toxin [Chloroflexota bacterium]
MNYRELARKLRALGCEFDRQARGDHEVWINRQTGARTTIPNWGGDDLRPGTVATILRDLGISRRDIDQA